MIKGNGLQQQVEAEFRAIWNDRMNALRILGFAVIAFLGAFLVVAGVDILFSVIDALFWIVVKSWVSALFVIVAVAYMWWRLNRTTEPPPPV